MGQDGSLLLKVLWALQDICQSSSHVLNTSGVLSQCDAHFWMAGTTLGKNAASGESAGCGFT